MAYAVDVSADPVPLRLELWLQSVFALAERVTDLAASTLSAKRRALERRLAEILSAPSRCDLTRELQAKIGRARDQLLVFLDHPDTVEVTNNGCERLLRPAVVQRKVTNGYRAMWVATGEADTDRVDESDPAETTRTPSIDDALERHGGVSSSSAKSARARLPVHRFHVPSMCQGGFCNRW